MDTLPDVPPPGYTRHEVALPDRLTVTIGAAAVLGEQYVTRWLATPHPALDGLTPSAVLDSDDPAVREGVAQVLVDLHAAGPDAVTTERRRIDLV